jgi:hypothetical protein
MLEGEAGLKDGYFSVPGIVTMLRSGPQPTSMDFPALLSLFGNIRRDGGASKQPFPGLKAIRERIAFFGFASRLFAAFCALFPVTAWTQGGNGNGVANPLDGSSGYPIFSQRNTLDPYNRTPQYIKMDQPLGTEGRLDEEFDFRLPIVGRMQVEGFFDDNVFNTSILKKSSFGTFIQPWFFLPFRHRSLNAGLGYSFRGSVYENVPQNNYVDNYVNAFSDVRFDHRNRLSLNGSISYAHDPLGTLFTQGNVSLLLKNPNEWQSQSFDALYRYGAEGAKGLLELRFNYMNRFYQNNPEFTRGRDLNQYNLGGAFYYRVLPKTSLLFEVNESFSDYLQPLPGGLSQTNNQLRVLGGVTWRATAKTTGILKGGVMITEFDETAAGFRDNGQPTPTFDAAILWQPRSIDSVRVGALMITNQSNFLGGATNNQTYTVTWNHQWLPKLSSNIYANAMENSYTGSNRTDSGYMLGVGVYYPLQRWLTSGLQYSYTDRSSTIEQFNFTRNLVILNLQMSF